MNILDKSAFAVVVIASGAFFLTAPSIADSSDSNNSVNTLINSSVVRQLKNEKTTDQETSNISLSKVLEPPPGPFADGSISDNNTQKAPSFPKEPSPPALNNKAPKEVLNLSNNPEMPSFNTKVVDIRTGTKELIQPEAPVNYSHPMGSNKTISMGLNAPVLSQALSREAPVFDVNAPETKLAPEFNANKPMINPQSTPIWMQNNYRLNQDDNIRQQQPTLPIQRQALHNSHPVQYWDRQSSHQIPNMGWKNQQQYIYVPIPLLPQNFGMPQIPNYWQPTAVGNINLSTPNLKENIK